MERGVQWEHFLKNEGGANPIYDRPSGQKKIPSHEVSYNEYFAAQSH